MSITSGIGLVSGIDTVSLIEQLLAIDSQAKVPIFQRISSLTAAKTALLDVNARMLSLGNTARSFRQDEVFRSVLASSSNEDVLGATASTKANPGQYTFRVKELVSSSQKMSGGFVTRGSQTFTNTPADRDASVSRALRKVCVKGGSPEGPTAPLEGRPTPVPGTH